MRMRIMLQLFVIFISGQPPTGCDKKPLGAVYGDVCIYLIIVQYGLFILVCPVICLSCFFVKLLLCPNFPRFFIFSALHILLVTLVKKLLLW